MASPTPSQEKNIAELRQQVKEEFGEDPIVYISAPTPGTVRYAFQTRFCDGGEQPTGPEVELVPDDVIVRLRRILAANS